MVSDNQALVQLRRIKDKNTRLLSWSLELSEYDYDVVYKKGTMHKDADTLTRMPHGHEMGMEHDENLITYFIKSLTAKKTFEQWQNDDEFCSYKVQQLT